MIDIYTGFYSRVQAPCPVVPNRAEKYQEILVFVPVMAVDLEEGTFPYSGKRRFSWFRVSEGVLLKYLYTDHLSRFQAIGTNLHSQCQSAVLFVISHVSVCVQVAVGTGVSALVAVR